MNKILFGLFLAAICLGCTTRSGEVPGHAEHGAPPVTRDRDQKWKASLARAPLAVTATFDENGRLWQVQIRGRHLYVHHSDDRGTTLRAPVKVNAEPGDILADGENRPKIIAHRGVIHVSYTRGLTKPMSGAIRFSRSTDGGRTFSAPVTVNDNHEIISHRFEAMGVNDRGQVFLAWLDKRDQSAAARRGGNYAGAAVYYAVSDNGGASFRPNVKAADHSCECCRVAMAMDVDGTPVILWRTIFGKNIRDHALLRLDGASGAVRASQDDWRVDGCPHHGPALSIGPDGVYHLAWFTAAPGRAGLYYRRSPDRGKSFTAPRFVGDADARPSRPQVLSLGSRVFLAWKELNGSVSIVRTMHSGDGGRTWSAPMTRATTSGASDHPLLIADKAAVYLSWHSLNEGWHLIRVTEGAS